MRVGSRAGRVGAWVWIGLALGGASCGSSEESDPAPPIVAESFDLVSHCSRVCRRASACGVEKAEALARSGPEADRAGLEALRAGQGEVEKGCVARCNAQAPGPQDLPLARKAAACLDQPDCASLEACLLGVTG